MRYNRITKKILADLIFERKKQTFLRVYGSKTQAKEELYKIITLIFDEIEQQVIEDNMVEIWGFGRFSLKLHKRFLTKKVNFTIGKTFNSKLKAKQKEYLNKQIEKIKLELENIDYDIFTDENILTRKRELEKELEKIVKALAIKGKSINPKYNKETNNEHQNDIV